MPPLFPPYIPGSWHNVHLNDQLSDDTDSGDSVLKTAGRLSHMLIHSDLD